MLSTEDISTNLQSHQHSDINKPHVLDQPRIKVKKKEEKDKLKIKNDRINFFPNPQYLLENYEIAEEPIMEISKEDSLSNES